MPCSVTWGLAAMRPCHALANNPCTAAGSGSSSPDRRAGTPPFGRSAASGSSSPRPGNMNKAHPTTPVSVDNPSRKPLYAICTTATVARAVKGDVLSMDLSPKEDGQPVIMVTLSHNDSVLLRAALPCASIAALQMYPFVTVLVSAVPCGGCTEPWKAICYEQSAWRCLSEQRCNYPGCLCCAYGCSVLFPAAGIGGVPA